MASQFMRSAPMLELAPEGRMLSAAYWLHDHPIPNQPKLAPHLVPIPSARALSDY